LFLFIILAISLLLAADRAFVIISKSIIFAINMWG